MTRRPTIAVLLFLAWTLASGLPGQSRTPAQVITPSTPIVLFDGSDMNAFYTWLEGAGREDHRRVFSLVDFVDGGPALRISGEEWGALVTRSAYQDYHLVMEFRWGLLTWGGRREAARDSGLLVHCQGPDGNVDREFRGPWMASVEAQIIEGGVGDFILVGGYAADGSPIVPRLTVPSSKDRDGEAVFDPGSPPVAYASGRINWFGRDPDWEDRLGFRGENDIESPDGEWTRLEVLAEGDRITNIVNGTVVNRGFESSLRSGRISVQSEGAEIFIRRIELRPLRSQR